MDFEKQRFLHRQLLASSLLQFTTKMFAYTARREYVVGEHHRIICNALMDVIKGKTNKLIINISPRYGKTLLCSQMFIAYGLALNPASKFLHISYSGSLVQDNSMAVKDTITSTYFQTLFPEVQIRKNDNTRSKWSTTAGGGEYATSTLGQITGFGAGQAEMTEDYIRKNCKEITPELVKMKTTGDKILNVKTPGLIDTFDPSALLLALRAKLTLLVPYPIDLTLK